MKNTVYALLLLLITTNLLITTKTQAQTKVFKEVSEDISSQLEPILQDGKLVGYLFFTTLEKSSADSFNYRLSIMDENLNDIGVVNFRQEHLDLKGVAFEQDILCLAYIKSNFVGKEFKNGKEFRRETSNAKTALFAQFVDLNGKIVGTSNTLMDVKPETEVGGYYSSRLYGNGRLKHALQLRNIPGKGFACFYGDDSRNNLLVYNTTGNMIWKNQVREDANDFYMLTSGTEVYFLLKKDDAMKEGGYEVVSYNTADSAKYPKFIVKDKKGNSLKVLSFNNDPVTGKPYISGLIIDPRNGNRFLNGNQLAMGPYDGTFTINLNGHKKNDIQPAFSYWSDNSQSFANTRGYVDEVNGYGLFENSFKDFQGNTWFVGSAISHKAKWVSIGFAVVTLPLIIPPLGILGVFGSQKCNFRDVLLLRQDPKGVLTLADHFPCDRGSYIRGMVPIPMYNNRSLYKVSNSDTHTDYVVVDDLKNIFIYNVNGKKVARTIPHKDGNTSINIFPAKEGYVMVREYNKKERTTRLSIEAL